MQWREKVWDEGLGREVTRRASEFFARVEDREKRYLAVAAAKQANESTGPGRAELRQWRAFMTAAAGVPWQTILAGYHAHLDSTGRKPCTETVASWGETYLEEQKAKLARGDLSADSERHKRRALTELVSRLGHMPLDRIRAGEVEKMIDAMGNGHGPTFNGYRKIYFAFFNRAVEARVLRENPIAEMKSRRFVIDNTTRILTPQQTAQLFHFAMGHPTFGKIIGRLALEFFLGVRFSSSYRASEADINAAERTVKLPADKLKTGMESGVSHMVDTNNFPGLDPLWEWLAIAPKEGWNLEPREYMGLKSGLFTAAGVPHPQNCARKSFATYDLAAWRNPGRTAYILGHVDQEELWNDYKGNATQAAAQLYQRIAPTTARQIAAGEPLPVPSRRRRAPARRDGS
mgnify:CR=1 FL=1